MELLKDPRARAEEGEATRDVRAPELNDWVKERRLVVRD